LELATFLVDNTVQAVGYFNSLVSVAVVSFIFSMSALFCFRFLDRNRTLSVSVQLGDVRGKVHLWPRQQTGDSSWNAS